jgi:fumarate reductase subunit C
VPSYQRRIGVFWWLGKRTYFVFAMRELSSIFVAWFVAFLLLFISAVGSGEQAYEDFLDWAAHPVLVVLNAVALGFVVLHAITWFALTPQAMVLRVRGQRVPAPVIIASQYVGLLVVSAIVYWLVTG